LICNIIGCNAEGYVKMMFYYFHGKQRQPMFKEIMRVCEIHAKKMAAEDTNIRIQPLA